MLSINKSGQQVRCMVAAAVLAAAATTTNVLLGRLYKYAAIVDKNLEVRHLFNEIVIYESCKPCVVFTARRATGLFE